MSGGGSSGSTTAQTKPWEAQRPLLKEGFGAAQQLFQQGAPDYYPGRTTAKIAPETNLGWNMQADRAQAGSPLVGASQGYLQDVLGGHYLNADSPERQGLRNSMWSSVAPNVNSQFSLGGRYGSGQHTDSLAAGFTNAIAPYEYGTYGAERGMMQDAAGMAPQLAAQDYIDAAAMQDVGSQRQAEQQKIIDAKMQKYGYDANKEAMWLNQYLQQVGGTGYGSETTTPYYQPPWWQQAIGAGLGTAGALGSLGFGF